MFLRELRGWKASAAAVVLAAAGIAWRAGVAGPEPSPRPSPETESPLAAEPAPRLPAYLQGVDLDQPAQSAFATWPPASIEERAYWLPWAPVSLQRARIFRQPIFLLLTVPWNRSAQRMQAETLADGKVLRAINAGYISIAVQADRRPDLRERYPSGLWPTIQLLLPDGRPMLSQANPSGKALPISFGFVDRDQALFLLAEGRKYFDKWAVVLSGVADVYDERVAEEELRTGPLRLEVSDELARWLVGNFDARNGGFEAAPKFDLPGLAEYAAARQARLVPALAGPARKTLEKLVASPLYDAREGGLHRAAGLKDWGGIEYEKLLTVNAELARELVFSLRGQDSATLRAALRGTLTFVTTVLARPGGGFWNAQCADPASRDGGKYWTAAAGTVPAPPVPPLDRLVLSGPNALAGAALVRGGRLLDDPALVERGREALDLVVSRAFAPGRGVGHVIEPRPEPWRFLASQAQVAFALEDAYETTGNVRYLETARDIVEFCRRNLRTEKEAAFRDHLEITAPLGLLKHVRHPMPENVMVARTLLRLGAIDGSDEYRADATKVLEAYLKDLTAYRVHGIECALAVEEAMRDPLVVTLDGDPGDPRVEALRNAALGLPRAWTVLRNGAAAAAPAAELRLGAATRRVAAPEALAREAAAIAGSRETRK